MELLARRAVILGSLMVPLPLPALAGAPGVKIDFRPVRPVTVLPLDRCDVEVTFGAELNGLPTPERRELLDALAASSSWALWDSLRAEAGDSPEEAQAVLRRTLRALLAGPPPAV